MPIKKLQKRLTQVGVIRLGDQLMSKNNKPYPHKLEKFRFTSPSRHLVEAVAEKYGGQPRPWQNTTGPEFEVHSDVKEIAVLVPPQLIDPSYEHWGNGYRDRLCDGETETIRGCACMCLKQWGDKFHETAPLGQACKPTTRLSLMLADIPSLGTWKLESKGWNAASELPMLAEAIANASQPIPARLEIQARQKKTFDPGAAQDKQIESRSFLVPVLHFDFVTPAQAFGGQLTAAARKALGAGNEGQKALDSAPANMTPPQPSDAPQARMTPEHYRKLAETATNLGEVQEAWRGAKADGVLDEALAAYLRKVGDKFAAKAEPAPTAETPAEPPADEIVDAEVVDDAPDADATWLAILSTAGDLRLSNDDLEQKVATFLGKTSDEANGVELARFHTALKNGRVA